MPDLTVERRLVKSPPELWAELSEVERLAKHLGAFGEIRITKLEPESSVAWEGEHASGTVEIEASGWGTKVVLTATLPEPPAPEPEPEPPPDPEPPTVESPALPTLESHPITSPQPARRGFLARWVGKRWGRRDVDLGPPVAETAPEPLPVEPQPEPEPMPPAAEPVPVEPEPEPEPVEEEPEQAEPDIHPGAAQEVLDGVLDTLGAAHHRPFSRS